MLFWGIVHLICLVILLYLAYWRGRKKQQTLAHKAWHTWAEVTRQEFPYALKGKCSVCGVDASEAPLLGERCGPHATPADKAAYQLRVVSFLTGQTKSVQSSEPDGN